jgi:hypothetical protein
MEKLIKFLKFLHACPPAKEWVSDNNIQTLEEGLKKHGLQ